MDAHRPCPDSALLAAFLDGTLADYERTAVVSHLVECAQCRAIALTVVEFQEVEALDALWVRETSAPDEPILTDKVSRWSRERTRAPALVGLALAALAALGVAAYFSVRDAGQARSPEQAMATLIDAAAAHRPLEARLAGVTGYAPPPTRTFRSRESDRARLHLIDTASSVREVYQHEDNVWARQALGVAALVSGDLDEAIAALEFASAATPDDPRIATDLAAAHYERARLANRPDDLPAALSAVTRVLSRDPANLEALFNRALIVSALGLRTEARTAWEAYLARDPASEWSAEARRRSDDLPLPSTPMWATLRQALESTRLRADAEAAVRYRTSAARDFVERELLTQWVAAHNVRDRAAVQRLEPLMRVLASAFERVTGDRLYTDLLTSLDAGAQRGLLSDHISALDEYLSALRLMAAQDFVKAERVWRAAVARLQRLENPLAARAQVELAASLYYALKHDEALEWVTAAERTARERQHAILVTRATWMRGMVSYARNDFAGSQEAYEAMLRSATLAGDVDQVVMAHVLLGNLHHTLGNAQRAWRHRIDGAERLDEVHSPSIRARFLGSAAGDASVGQHHDAALLFQTALIEPSDLPPSLEVQGRAQRARTLFALGRIEDARDELETARARLIAVPSDMSRLTVEADVLAAEVDVWADVDRVRARTASERLLTLPVVKVDRLRRARASLQLAEIAMADGNATQADAVVRDGLAALDAFHDSPGSEFIVLASDPVWRLYSVAARVALARGDLGSAFAYTERGRMRTVQERRAWGDRIPTLEQVQRGLPPGAALVILTQLDSQLHTWIIRATGVTTHMLPLTASRAAALVASQLQEIRRSAPTPRASGELFDLVVRPTLASLGDAGSIVVVADAPYNRIAFAGLWDRHTNRYFVEDHPVVAAPTATAYLGSLLRPGSTRTPPTLRLASFVATPNRYSSDGAQLAQSLTGLYTTGRIVVNEAATAQQLVDAVAGRDLVHIAAPIRANNDLPGLSYVDMGSQPDEGYGGATFARDVPRADPFRAQLVTLADGVDTVSAARAEDTFGFARALLAAGVANVVSPVVDVDAKSLARMWVDFHVHYAGGLPAAESLHRAQLAALTASDRRPGPWATLTVFGSTQ